MGSFEMAAGAPKPERHPSLMTVSVSPTDHRDWNSLTNPHLNDGDDLTVSACDAHDTSGTVPTVPEECQARRPSASVRDFAHATCRFVPVLAAGAPVPTVEVGGEGAKAFLAAENGG